MKKIISVLSLSLILGGIALAEEANQGAHRKQPCNGDSACEAQRKQFREERRKKFLDEKCHGDQACEAQMKQKFEEKHAKIKAAMDQCGNDENCRKEARKKMVQEFKQKKAERKKNAGGQQPPAIK